MDERFDVFLSHNSKDRAKAARLAYHLRDGYGLAVWFDQWQLVLGKPWMEALEQGLAASEAVAVLIGAAGLGKWENEEMRAALDTAVADPRRRVIPVLLPASVDPADLSAFLRRRTWVDFRGKTLDDSETLNLLYCGIKDIPPGNFSKPARLPALPLGAIPPANVVTYIHRGKIEDEVRDFLQKGNGAGAIVGLHAPGGLGKTELAKHAVEDLKAAFDDLLWVDVGEKTAPQIVVEVLTRLGVQVPPNASYEQQKNELQHRLRGCRFLIVFDDVRQKALDGLHDFLPPKPCAVLLTSRIQQIGGVQRTFELDHMTPKQAHALLQAILGAEAVTAEAEAAESLAKRCGYNPLALEIAARRIRQLQGIRHPIAHYFEMARQRFRELKMHGDARWDMERVFDISYLDLNEADRARFRALAVFHPTGFAPDAAAHLWGVDLPEARGTLSRFINLSLVKVVAGEQERYRLHDLLDEYAAGKLEQDGGAAEAHPRLADWLAALFEAHYTDDPSTAPQVALEIENLRRAMAWAAGQSEGNRLARLIHAARNWFVVLNLYAEWDKMAEKALALGISDRQQRADVLQAMGDVLQFRDEREAALERYEQALGLYRAVGDRLGEANVYSSQGQLFLPDDLNKADELLNRAITIYQRIGDKYSVPAQIGNFGWKLLRLGESEKARPYLLRAAELFEQIGLVDYAERHRKAAGG